MNHSINYRTLTDKDFYELFHCWNAAFSDYQVSIDMTLEQLNLFQTRNGYLPDVSVGIFENEKMIGFLLNGFREFDGVSTAYDSGTAIIPEYRGGGLSKEVFEIAENAVVKKGAKQYLLEVLKDNEKAINLYKKTGFEVARELDCFKTAKGKIDFVNGKGLEFKKVSARECSKFGSEFDDYKRCWQNTWDAILSVEDRVCAYVAKIDDVVAGYIVFTPDRGRIASIGVKDIFRKDGIYEDLVSFTSTKIEGDDIVAINLPKEAVDFKNALKSLGFESWACQYEMLKKF